MEQRRLGKSNVSASIITFGAWAISGWMWGRANLKDTVNAIKVAYENGISIIDTAPVYG